jgi:putative endonuclease
MKMVFWVYILLCENGSYYTGYTNDLKARYRSHCNGRGRCRYTRSFRPVALAQCWKINGDRAFAMQTERRIKQYSHAEKTALILKPESLSSDIRIQCVSEALHQNGRALLQDLSEYPAF